MDFTGPVIAGRGAVHEDPLCGGGADRPLAPADRTGPARHAPDRQQAVHKECGRGNGGEAGQVVIYRIAKNPSFNVKLAFFID